MIMNFNSTQLRTSLEYFCLFDLDRNELLSQSVQPQTCGLFTRMGVRVCTKQAFVP